MEESRDRVAGPFHSCCRLAGEESAKKEMASAQGLRVVLPTWGSSNSRCKVGHSPGLFETLKEVLMASVE